MLVLLYVDILVFELVEFWVPRLGVTKRWKKLDLVD